MKKKKALSIYEICTLVLVVATLTLMVAVIAGI
jgi:hypothetical protein